MAGDRRTPLPMSGQRFLPSLTGRRRRPSDAGDECALDTAAAVLRATRGAVGIMRRADDAGRRAHVRGDLGGFEAAWRSYHDAEQLYRLAAAQWESVAGTGSGRLDELPCAPAWSSNELETELAPLVIDLSVDAPSAPDLEVVVDEQVHESR